MANKNPLLSSVLSPLDDLPSVLMPSVPILKTVTESKNLLRNENILPLDVSVQTNLSSNSTILQAFSESLTKPGVSDGAVNTFMRPPVGLSNLGDSFLRKPTGKYVVPPGMDSQNKAGDSGLSNLPRTPPVPFMVPSQEDTMSSTIPKPNVDYSQNIPTKPASFEAMADNPPYQSRIYHPVIPHWFFGERKPVNWMPFSFTDSLNLEEAYRQGIQNIVSTDGGRYDVSVLERKKTAVYWEAESLSVRRCSWFRKVFSAPLPVPYSEEDAIKLEAEFKDAMKTGRWHRQVVLSGGERVMMNSSTSIQHYLFQESSEFPNTVSVSDAQQTPQVVRRGADDFAIPECTANQVDHLLFMIHGIGNFCDIRFRTVEECVDDFRALGEDLLATHFKEAIEAGSVGRIEVLPISWHKALHGDATGIDKKLKLITLRSIPKFREFTNDTLLDVLFFTSPVYGQHIMDTVSSEMERLLKMFKVRNPNFGGKVSVVGHSLGTVILFDLLSHQKTPNSEEETPEKEDMVIDKENDWVKVDSHMINASTSMSKVNFEIGGAGTGQPAIVYPQLSFQPLAFFLMGSPLGMFITVRGLDTLGPDFRLPTCNRVFNIFHPFDPVAYRIETLIDPSLSELRPVLIPHHKGRKRMHLELKDTIERVGSDIKNRIVDSIQATWNTMYQLYSGDFSSVNQALQDQLLKNAEMAEAEHADAAASRVHVGKLNGGRRIDYALQEKPYESLTEYIFALQAHLTYWSSEDTLLMILKELYSIDDIYSDVAVQGKRRLSAVPTGAAAISLDAQQTATSSSISTINVPSSVFPSTVPFGVGAPPPQPPIAPFNASAFSTPPSIPPPIGNTQSLPPQMGTVPLTDQPSLLVPNLTTGTPAVMPRTISGRPVCDPSLTPAIMGVDPTASPASSAVGPPPKLPKMSFNKK